MMGINQDIRNKLMDDTVVFDDCAYDDAIIGMPFDGRAIYVYEKMVEVLMDRDFMDETGAMEWIGFKTIRALPYIQGKRPIILYKGDIF